MPFVQSAVDGGDAIYSAWVKRAASLTTLAKIASFVAQCRGGLPIGNPIAIRGSFNACFRVKFDDGKPDALIRFPCPGLTVDAEEKVRFEVFIMRFVAQNTRIPVPRLISWGLTKESPDGLGPYIIMDFVQGKTLSEFLTGNSENDPPCGIVDCDIDQEVLRSAYSQMANIILELSSHNMPRIGSINYEGGSWTINAKAFTINFTGLATCGHFPPNRYPDQAFDQANTYLQALADVHMSYLKTQRTDQFQDAQDCRCKYVARKLFQRITLKMVGMHDSGPFKLYGDDLRPGNVLVDDYGQIVAVIDWEYTYAAPVEFLTCAPWWLLLTQPQQWPSGLDAFWSAYREKFKIFIDVFEKEEQRETGLERAESGIRISQLMRQSLENGSFWFQHALRDSFHFDDIYWSMLDEERFGSKKSWLDRLNLLTSEEKHEMEALVKEKFSTSNEPKSN